MLKCSKCGQLKDETEFNGNKAYGKGHAYRLHEYYCKQCKLEWERNYRKKRREAFREYAKFVHKMTQKLKTFCTIIQTMITQKFMLQFVKNAINGLIKTNMDVERCVANKHYLKWGLNGVYLKKKVSNCNPSPNHPFLVCL